MTSTAADPVRQRRVSRLMIFFAKPEPICTEAEPHRRRSGLTFQPLCYFLKQIYHWTPVQVSAVLTVTWLPWIIKPIYGIISDFLPLFGYRRKAYLILSNVLATASYLALAPAVSPGAVIFYVMLTAYGMAARPARFTGALLVENGQDLTASASFVNQQWLWFNIAQVGVTLLGGALVQYMPPSIGTAHRRPARGDDPAFAS